MRGSIEGGRNLRFELSVGADGKYISDRIPNGLRDREADLDVYRGVSVVRSYSLEIPELTSVYKSLPRFIAKLEYYSACRDYYFIFYYF